MVFKESFVFIIYAQQINLFCYHEIKQLWGDGVFSLEFVRFSSNAWVNFNIYSNF